VPTPKNATRPPSDQPDGLLSLRCVAVSLRTRSPKPCLPCRSTGRAGLGEARRVAIVSGQRSPTTKAYARDDADQAALLSYRKVAQRELGRAGRKDATDLFSGVGYAASLVAIALRMSSVNWR
jgi:hypothetical protein